ncbi:MAG TPA: bifunctional alpha,alpha-trehalose-phosphate synthase (UDP-forming)/trehalose-phosphatase [Candidatus Binatia bacterium]|jgi:trehalose 6-phosphate synthase/phosphatase|nr:bifunctional alpha,alpha-trehalose-phosphate synthase (UDP-forming)/trehalose-phosphatase [Candidatus Binatia bacterium]
MDKTSLMPKRTVVVSNRLPFTVIQENGAIQFKDSVGGVATGLRSVLCSSQSSQPPQPEYVWVGWPGSAINSGLQKEVQSKAFSEFHSYPVFLSEQDIEDFYQGFCNRTLWPLFHYFPSHARYEEAQWLHYKKVNRFFSDALLKIIKDDDVLWIHDYHLMLLPNLIRNELPDLRIGFFLHIPFPQFELFRLLPEGWRREILEGLLGADLVGFHVHDYARYFLRCVQRILGHKHYMDQLTVDARPVQVSTFPMGVDFQKFFVTAASPEVKKEKEGLRKAMANSKVVLSVDRQDYSKGIIHRLKGFEKMLEMNPEWHGRVSLVMVVVPSRIGIQDYEDMKKQIEELIGRINGKFGSLTWTPIVYQYRSVPFETLVALYAMSDVALVTPLRDGMNLVAKEYLASRTDESGVLILSEMAGAAKELREAVIINPNDPSEIAGALKMALEMSLEEQVSRNRIMQKRLRRYDVARWAHAFLNDVTSVRHSHEKFYGKLLGFSGERHILQQYSRSVRRLLLLDCDVTLVPYVKRPYLARPSEELLKILHKLTVNSKNEVVLVSGRDRSTLQTWFGSLPVGLVAEHGVWIKQRHQDWSLIRPLESDWKRKMRPLLEAYADRLTGAFVEEKEFSLVWHCRAADEREGIRAARELTDDLLAFTANMDVQILPGNRIVEVRCGGVNKGIAAQQWLSRSDFDFILAVGDDKTGEDMFMVLPERANSIRVGMPATKAQFTLHKREDVLGLLKQFIREEEFKGETLPRPEEGPRLYGKRPGSVPGALA